MSARTKATGMGGRCRGGFENLPKADRLPGLRQKTAQVKVTALQGGHEVAHDVERAAAIVRVPRESGQQGIQEPGHGRELCVGAAGTDVDGQPGVPQIEAARAQNLS